MNVTEASVRGLCFINHSNHCYANATVSSLLWVACSSVQGLAVHSLSLSRLLRWLTRRPQTVKLWDLRVWQNMTRSWHRPDIQHDAAEFLHYLAGVCCPEAPDFWQARSQAPGQTEVADHGEMWLLLAMVAPRLGPGNQCSLQSLFIAWRNQAERHALVSLPAVLPLQICRFANDGRKLRFRVNLSKRVYVPYFTGSDISTSSHPYQVVAIVYHIGQSRTSGHYRAALLKEGDIRFVTDDHQLPQEPSEVQSAEVLDNSYIFFLQRL